MGTWGGWGGWMARLLRNRTYMGPGVPAHIGGALWEINSNFVENTCLSYGVRVASLCTGSVLQLVSQVMVVGLFASSLREWIVTSGWAVETWVLSPSREGNKSDFPSMGP